VEEKRSQYWGAEMKGAKVKGSKEEEKQLSWEEKQKEVMGKDKGIKGKRGEKSNIKKSRGKEKQRRWEALVKEVDVKEKGIRGRGTGREEKKLRKKLG
jgi:hypothetical protein